MTEYQRHCIFTLLYAVVLIDNRVKKVEVDLFFARIESFLHKTNFIETVEAKAIISDWFVQNYKFILSKMKSPNKENFLLGYVKELKFYLNRQEVFDVMEEIAMSDEEYHDDEKEFITKVAKIWGIL